MKLKITAVILSSVLLYACNNNEEKETPSVPQKTETKQTFQNKGHEVVYNMVQKVGNYDSLAQLKDVVYTYTYQTPDGKADVTTEKYIFDGELSYGLYKQHERTFPDLEGPFEQGYDGKEYWLKHNGEILNDTTMLKRVAFSRPTNFYWFTMFQKLLDPGLTYEYLGEKTVNEANYDVVNITFESNNGKPTDIYQIYINQNTLLVDQFLFTVADFGVMEIPFLMTLEYENVDGLLIPTKRKYKKSTWDAEVTDQPWINVTWTDIAFNNGLSKEDFTK